MAQSEHPQTEVLYNADCPVCRFEINHYADYARTNALPLQFSDLNDSDLARWSLTPDQAATRLYLLQDGKLLSGIPAFLVLWAEMPRYRWLARLVGLPGIRQLAVFTYDGLLAPLLYWTHLRRQRRSAPG